MHRGDNGPGDERLPFPLRRVAQHVTRNELLDLRPEPREDSLRFLRILLGRRPAASALRDQSPDAVEPPEAGVLDVALFGLTPAAAAVLGPARTLEIARLPFRVGRQPVAGESQPLEVNDLQISDTLPFNVSRSHFAIERGPDGVQVRDRGSYLGTIVNGVQIGGHRLVAAGPLVVGENEVVVGSRMSPFRFGVVVALRQPNSRPDRQLHSAYRD